ncbi:MAG: HNH endonuclease signature motif containing protein [Synechocystis sp.]|jgi:hypothetical protein
MELDGFDKLVKDYYEGNATIEDVVNQGFTESQLACFVVEVQALERERDEIVSNENKKRIENLRKKLRGIWSNIEDHFDDQCYVCGFDYIPLLQIHHKKPLKYGGDNEISNLCQLCPNCHALAHQFARIYIRSIYPCKFDDPEYKKFENWMNNNLTPNQIEKLSKLSLVEYQEHLRQKITEDSSNMRRSEVFIR